MERNNVLYSLSRSTYDLIVIGGGVYGASVARDAALRGLKVALLEQGDFGHATSANFHKIIHGGLRYLQHVDIVRMRESARERSTLLRIAPHLIDLMPFVVPTYKGLWQGRLVMSVALKLNDLITADRNLDVPPEKAIPAGCLLSRDEILALCPGLINEGVTGAALFHDGQVHNGDRLILAILWSAVSAGADVVNYVRATKFVTNRDKIKGVDATDILTGTRFQIPARMVINCTGPWMNQMLGSLSCRRSSYKPVSFFKAVVLVTRQFVKQVGLCVPGPVPYRDRDAILCKGHRYLVITPWRDRSLVGTYQVHSQGENETATVSEGEISDFLCQINLAYPAANLKLEDVHFVYAGFLPAAPDVASTKEPQWLKHYKIVDHEKEFGVGGLISVIGVKFTTARAVAEKVVDLALNKLGMSAAPCQTAKTPVYGGDLRNVWQTVKELSAQDQRGVSGPGIRHLVQTYGSRYEEILDYCDEDPTLAEPVTSGVPVIKAEVVHGVRAEMAQTLSDIIFRRTELGTAGYPGDDCLHNCARIVAAELQWGNQRIRDEIEMVRAHFNRVSCLPREIQGTCASS